MESRSDSHSGVLQSFLYYMNSHSSEASATAGEIPGWLWLPQQNQLFAIGVQTSTQGAQLIFSLAKGVVVDDTNHLNTKPI